MAGKEARNSSEGCWKKWQCKEWRRRKLGRGGGLKYVGGCRISSICGWISREVWKKTKRKPTLRFWLKHGGQGGCQNQFPRWEIREESDFQGARNQVFISNVNTVMMQRWDAEMWTPLVDTWHWDSEERSGPNVYMWSCHNKWNSGEGCYWLGFLAAWRSHDTLLTWQRACPAKWVLETQAETKFLLTTCQKLQTFRPTMNSKTTLWSDYFLQFFSVDYLTMSDSSRLQVEAGIFIWGPYLNHILKCEVFIWKHTNKLKYERKSITAGTPF